MLAYVDGELVPEAQAAVSIFDSGFNFADGVFEGIRVYGGRVFRLEEHLSRLVASARVFEIEIPLDRDALRGEILRWLRANDVGDAFHFRPIVTRGRRFPPRLDPRFAPGPSTVVFVGGPVTAGRRDGIGAAVAELRRIAPSALDPHAKSLNYGNNILARLEAHRRGVDDLLMLDDRGYLAEATAANVFLVYDGALLTPTTYSCLEGITRSAVLELARAHGVTCEEADIEPEMVADAEEIFLTGTGVEILPVIELDGIPVGDGGTGELTTQLQADYEELIRSEAIAID